MLTKDEENYIEKIPADKKVKFFPYDPKIVEIAEKTISKIKNVMSDADIRFMGASALGISGQNDIDIYVLTSRSSYSKYSLKLKKLFGEPLSGISLIEWNFIFDGYDVSVYLDDPEKESTKKQIKTFEILKKDKSLLSEYEKIKVGASKLSYREYQKAKYAFFHTILGE